MIIEGQSAKSRLGNYSEPDYRPVLRFHDATIDVASRLVSF